MALTLPPEKKARPGDWLGLVFGRRNTKVLTEGKMPRFLDDRHQATGQEFFLNKILLLDNDLGMVCITATDVAVIG